MIRQKAVLAIIDSGLNYIPCTVTWMLLPLTWWRFVYAGWCVASWDANHWAPADREVQETCQELECECVVGFQVKLGIEQKEAT